MTKHKITAVLGPTNTGKTHLAIETMLSFETGMIGFPLRLLAREVYDKIIKKISTDKVALITGEEKIIPTNAKYFLCTVESMPIDKEVDFVGIDEIQMCADHERGHIFTERLLSLRGQKTTMFMGSSSMKNIISKFKNFIDKKLDFNFHNGCACAEEGDHNEAIILFTKSIEFDNHVIAAYNQRGLSKYELDDYNGAIADFTKTIELDPNAWQPYSNRAMVKSDLKDHSGAMADYNKSIELDPNPATYANRGMSKNDFKDYSGAVNDFTKAIELEPNDSFFTSDCYKRRGISRELLGDLNAACADWKKAAEFGDTEAAEKLANNCN